MIDVEDLCALNVRGTRKYALTFSRNAWNTPKRRRAQEIKEIANVPRTQGQVERPIYDQMKSIGMTIGPITNKTIFQRPDVFSLGNVPGYSQTKIARSEFRKGLGRLAPLP